MKKSLKFLKLYSWPTKHYHLNFELWTWIVTLTFIEQELDLSSAHQLRMLNFWLKFHKNPLIH